MGLPAWMIASRGEGGSSLISYLILIQGYHTWPFWLGRRKPFAPPTVFHFQKVSSRWLRAESLTTIWGCWERQPQTIRLGLKLLLKLGHHCVYFQGRKGEPSKGTHLKSSKFCFPQVPSPSASATFSGLWDFSLRGFRV